MPDDPPIAIVLETAYGRMIVNRHDNHRVANLVRSGRAHDHREIELLAHCVALWGGQGVVLDVGANVGTHTLALAAVIGPGRQVHAFEPQRAIFHMLAGSVALNGRVNVRCHNIALGERDGDIALPGIDYTAPQNFGAVSFAAAPPPRPGWDSVPIRRLDGLGFQDVALIKIDVEGMEMRVLDGAAETIQRTRPLIYIEHSHVDAVALKARIEAWGYAAHPDDINFVCIPRELAGKIPVNARQA
ncbi:MAG TPA: FkbM family methyltransferase [Caulobacteraceae bacterium]